MFPAQKRKTRNLVKRHEILGDVIVLLEVMLGRGSVGHANFTFDK